jgi:ATP-dependent RNA helicase DeaD
VELAERLEARGFASAPLSGDIQQAQRERTIERLKQGKLDILVATDVAARGLDVERISHVINYDLPTDPEQYVHRIGRTGRAGRSGEAILFAAPRERRMLRTIDYAVGQMIEPYELPTTSDVNQQRIVKFKQRIDETIEDGGLEVFSELVADYAREKEHEPELIAAALASMVQGEQPFLLTERAEREDHAQHRKQRDSGGADFRRPDRRDRDELRPRRPERGSGPRSVRPLEEGMERFRVEVGHRHGVKPGQLVGAIAGESGLEGRLIGRIELYDDFSTVDLPEGMPGDIFRILGRTRVCGQELRLSRLNPAQIKQLGRQG